MPDKPASTDELGFDTFAVPLARTIAATDRSTTPWTIGVYGEWGSGKTTFLNLVEKELKSHGVRPIWFNAWKYAREDNLWAALIETIVLGARRSVPWYRRPDVRLRIWRRSIDFRTGFWELFRKLGVLVFKVALLAVLILMAISLVPVPGNPVSGSLAGSPLLAEPWVRVLVGVVAALGTKPDALLKLFDVKLGADLGAFRRRRSHRSQTAVLDDFTAEFQGVLKVVYGNKPLVVIIDDLDRCLPEQTLQIIETVKLFLDEPGCVFLLAVDREVIEHAIRVKYKDLPSVAELGETFFEKIVQLPYSLPPPAQSRVDAYIRSISTDVDVRACVPILRGTTPYNPRRIKRSVQAFALLKELSAEISPVPPVLAKLVVIQSQFRQVYRAAINDHGLLVRLERACRAPQQVDDVARAEAERFSTQYPGLNALFCHEISDRDTFEAVPVEAYLSIVETVVAVAEEPEPVAKRAILVICVRHDQEWGERLARVLRSAGEHVVVTNPGYPRDLPHDLSIIVWSAASARQLLAERSWTAATSAGERLLVVRVDTAAPAAPLTGRDHLDVAEMAPAEMETALLVHLGHRPPPAELVSGPVITNLPAPQRTLVDRSAVLPPLGPFTVLVGMPGSGKSAIALRCGHDRMSSHDIVWRIRADRRDDDMAALAQRLDVTPDEVRGRLAVSGRWLLIYDGFEDPNAVIDEIPVFSSGSVLVTSRDRDWGRYGSVVEIGPLARAESIALLDVRGAAEVAEALGDLPLALECARAYLHGSGASAAEYLALLDERGTKFVQNGELSVHAVLSGAVQAVHELDGMAREVLRKMSFFGSTGVPREVIMRAVTEDRVAFDLAVSMLVRHSLVTISDGDFNVNPLLQRFARESALAVAPGPYVRDVLSGVSVPEDLAELHRLTPQVRVLARHTATVEPAATVALLVRLGSAWITAGVWQQARECALHAASIDEDDAAVRELLELARGNRVLLLGPHDQHQVGELRAEMKNRRVEVIDSDSPVRYLVTSPYSVDCLLVAVTNGEPPPELAGEAAVARAAGVREGVLVLLGAGAVSAELVTALGPGADGLAVVRVDSASDVRELADALEERVRRERPSFPLVSIRSFRVLVVDGFGAGPHHVEFGREKVPVRVAEHAEGPFPAGVAELVLEMDQSRQISVGTRFNGTLGRGVVTRLVK